MRSLYGIFSFVLLFQLLLIGGGCAGGTRGTGGPSVKGRIINSQNGVGISTGIIFEVVDAESQVVNSLSANSNDDGFYELSFNSRIEGNLRITLIEQGRNIPVAEISVPEAFDTANIDIEFDPSNDQTEIERVTFDGVLPVQPTNTPAPLPTQVPTPTRAVPPTPTVAAQQPDQVPNFFK